MSELKTYDFPVDHGDFTTTIELFYLKSEADKVIAELEKKLDLYKRGFKEDDRVNAYLYAQLRHHKYKRCLAMAEWCKRKRIDAADYRIPRGKWDFYDKWHERWRALAKKFKPNNSTAQQGKEKTKCLKYK